MNHTKDCQIGDNWKDCPACLEQRRQTVSGSGPTDGEIKTAMEADFQQWFTNSLTPDRGYPFPIDNVKALITKYIQ